MTASGILVAVAWIAFAGCDGSAPPVERERRVGSPVSVVSTPTSLDEGAGDAFDCEDECGEPDCSCLVDPAPAQR